MISKHKCLIVNFHIKVHRSIPWSTVHILFTCRVTEQIKAYLKDDVVVPLLVTGDAGCGKSSIMAKAAANVEEEKYLFLRYLRVTDRSILRMKFQNVLRHNSHSPSVR
jgi:hypothetical protein